MEAPDQFIVRTTDNKEVILYTNPETRYTIEGKAGRYADLRVGTEINSAYTVRDNRNWVSTVTVGPVTVTFRKWNTWSMEVGRRVPQALPPVV